MDKDTRLNIVELIEEAIVEQNKLESRIPKEIASIVPFKLSDYNYLSEFINEFSNEFEFYRFITFSNVLIWRELSTYESRKSIWYWKNIDNEDFLKKQINTIKDTLDSYVLLLKSKQYKSAFIVFRTFIELSAQLFACLVDYEFYLKYTKDLLEADYQKHWYKYLKPEKVISNLRKIKSVLQKDRKDNGYAVLGDYRALTFPFESNVRNLLYNDFSNLSHGNYNQISNLTPDEIVSYLHMTTDYLSTVIGILKISIEHYLLENKNIDNRKHIITQSIWIKAIYKI